MTRDRIQQPQLWEAVAAKLREDILSGDLPPGERLNEVELATRFGTSRGPIREAARELAREGLVIDLRRRGHVVSTLTSHDLLEVYAVREALELAAIKALGHRATDAQLRGLGGHLEAMESAMGQGDWLAAADFDLSFHRELVGLAANSRLTAANEQMLSQTRLLLSTAGAANQRLRTEMPPTVHRDLLEAVMARDVAGAAAAIDRHYRHAEDRLLADLG